MKTWRWFLALLVFATLPSIVFGQSFAISNSVIAGGGGASTNASYSVTGTIGQPDAGARMIGGSFAVEGGFWSAAIAVQTPGAPFLSVTRSGANLIITWPSAGSASYNLEQTSTVVAPASWATSGATVSDDGTTRTVTVPAAPGYQFFRLKKP